MNEQSPHKHLGRKIWYITAISLSMIIILTCITLVIGTWVVQNGISQAAVKLLETVDDTTGNLRQAVSRIDQPLSELEGITDNVANRADQISENISDKGLLLTLLPEEQEMKITELITTVRETYDTVSGFITSTIGFYQSINALPFVNLPLPEQDTVESIQTTIQDVQTTIQEMRQGITDFRDNASGTINQVTDRINQASTHLSLAREKLIKLDSDLARFQEVSRSLKTTIPILFICSSILISILAGFIVFTQVEFINLYVNKWKKLAENNTQINTTESINSLAGSD